jgi:hypothetical protein
MGFAYPFCITSDIDDLLENTLPPLLFQLIFTHISDFPGGKKGREGKAPAVPKRRVRQEPHPPPRLTKIVGND